MEDLIIWTNPACSKCRKTLEILEERGVVPVLREYLKHPPSREELDEAGRLVGFRQLVRNNHEALVSSSRTAETMSTDEMMSFLVEYPDAIQRPVVFFGGRACIARPPENVLALLDES